MLQLDLSELCHLCESSMKTGFIVLVNDESKKTCTRSPGPAEQTGPMSLGRPQRGDDWKALANSGG